jgi:hypothetical protein
MIKPKINMKTLCRCVLEKPIDQEESARQGVIGIVLNGLIKLVNFLNRSKLSSEDLTAKL